MPGVDGITVTRTIRAKYPKMLVLMLTAHEDHALLIEAIKAGAAGYVVKRAVEGELLNAIQAVMRGDLYVHPAVTRALLPVTPSGPPQPDYEKVLTAREIEVLRLIAQGNTNMQIANILSLSVRTVESHRANIMDKLRLNNRAELVRYAHDHGLLNK
jgi:two-component system response regulator NreC